MMQEIKALLEKISPWPWSTDGEDVDSHKTGQEICFVRPQEDDAIQGINAEFIAKSPEIIASLIKRVEELEMCTASWKKEELYWKDMELKYQAARTVAIKERQSYTCSGEYCMCPINIDKEIAEELERLKKEEN